MTQTSQEDWEKGYRDKFEIYTKMSNGGYNMFIDDSLDFIRSLKSLWQKESYEKGKREGSMAISSKMAKELEHDTDFIKMIQQEEREKIKEWAKGNTIPECDNWKDGKLIDLDNLINSLK